MIHQSLVSFARAANGMADLLDRLARGIRAWSEKKEKHR
jgi:hypothetical protein